MPIYRGTGHEIYWQKDDEDPNSPYISVEPKPWEQQFGRNLEPYPKFTVEGIVARSKVHFDLNFDDTYYLSIDKGNGAIRKNPSKTQVFLLLYKIFGMGRCKYIRYAFNRNGAYSCF